MALGPRDIPLTFREVYDWVQEAKKQKKNKRDHVHQRLDAHLKEHNLEGAVIMVDGEEHDLSEYIAPVIERMVDEP
jgi:hypothetical protein